ncbi:tRNA glutamyl-Q(34) synthetase GluQRS [Luteimonas sp. BDR2-5]|uniref:tRNA glutamyl-Q(34) synthetase GluQRS n=1 Tax=Proluteimonas luteida TaxID=2878685 RepID=UPI001E51BB61|nr:tRNA glutamyl-Q(34) synthetase GluQRS [Luteimonas sp. BDR2-5]MCD9026924.1 tRNA glutamyl-Q(34) synthetase GluQRS [Luteimonas sp. BDR2-5]
MPQVDARPASGYVGRFAPSPTGPLHAGSLVAALGSWLMARHHRGRWLVRIEDLDPPREMPGAAAAQLRMLEACGLRSDGPVVRQSGRDALYQAALDRLLASGDAFVCHCSRSDLAMHGGRHRGRCVAASPRPDPAIRLRVPDGSRIAFDDAVLGRIEQDVATEVGDFVLRRADGLWAYQLAVVVDDGAQGVTDIVRGADLLDSTARQILLQRRLGLPTPRYAHLPLVVDGHGHKLSKSSQALPLRPDDPLPALRAAWQALGQAPAAVAAAESVPAFLRSATAAFQPSRMPSVPVALAATHNSDVTNPD